MCSWGGQCLWGAGKGVSRESCGKVGFLLKGGWCPSSAIHAPRTTSTCSQTIWVSCLSQLRGHPPWGPMGQLRKGVSERTSRGLAGLGDWGGFREEGFCSGWEAGKEQGQVCDQHPLSVELMLCLVKKQPSALSQESDVWSPLCFGQCVSVRVETCQDPSQSGWPCLMCSVKLFMPSRRVAGPAVRAALPFLTANLLLVPNGGWEVEGSCSAAYTPALRWALGAPYPQVCLGTKESSRA